MKRYFTAAVLLLSGLTGSYSFAEGKEIAITIDDLPFVGTTNNKPGNLQREHERFMNILNALVENKVPATGFVIGGTIEKDQWQLLQQFHDEGFVIANHTQTHLNLNSSNAEKYIADIDRADKVLAPLMTEKKFFRYPYLAEGKAEKKEEVRRHLASKNYTIAPITVDSKDFKFNANILAIHWRSRPNYIGGIKKQYLAYIWNQTLRAERHAEKKYGKEMPQILLIHANYLNSYSMNDILEMYRKNGYKFISLDQALNEYKKMNAEPSHQINSESGQSIELEN